LGSYIGSVGCCPIIAISVVHLLRRRTSPATKTHVVAFAIQTSLLGLGTLVTGYLAVWFILFVVLFPMKGLG
jgi:hypothetical protein